MFGATTGAGGQSSFSFGASAANNNTSAPKASFSFGVPAATSNTASGTTGGAFGLGNTNNQTSQPATGMFGQPAAKPSVFGTQQNATPAAGGATGSTGLFGSAGQALNQTQTGTSGGLGMFGQAQNTNQAGQANNAFGATQAKPAFGFGNTSTTQAPNTGFGQTSTNAAPASNLFGSTTTQPTSNLFGSTAAKPTTNLFGGSTTAAAQPSTNLFGGSTAAQPANNLFGSSTAAQPSSNLFGSTAAQPAKPGLFGTSSTTQPAGQFSFGAAQQPQQNAFGLGQSTAPTNSFGLGQSTQQQQQQQQQPIQQSQYQQQQSQLAVSILGQSTFKREVPIVQRLEGIKAAWDPSHPDCKFKCVLYNSVEPQDVHRYGRPPNVSDEIWEKANRENPDPSCMVPVIATGWEDVQKRLKGQVDMVQKEDHQIKELSKKLDIIERQKAIQTTIRLVGLQTKLSSLHERLVHLAVNTASTVQPSTSSSSSAPIRAKEQQLKSTLESVKAELDGSSAARSASSGSSSNGYGYGRSSVYGLNDRVIRPSTPKRSAAGQRMMGQVNELWGAVEELRRRRGYRGQESEGWLGDERVMNEIGQVLSEQQNALQKLMTVLSEAEFDQKVIDETLRNVGF